MQIQRIQNNNVNCGFGGKLTFVKIGTNATVTLKTVVTTESADEILYDAFLQATQTNRHGICFGIGRKDDNYWEYLKKLKEISNFDVESLARGDKRRMYGYSHANDSDIQERHYQIKINGDDCIIAEHDLKFIPYNKAEK